MGAQNKIEIWRLGTGETIGSAFTPTAAESQTWDAVKTRHGVHYQGAGIVPTFFSPGGIPCDISR